MWLFSRRRRWAVPREMSADAAAHWGAIVMDVNAGHFVKSDMPLLTAYCNALALAERAHHAIAQCPFDRYGLPTAWHTILAEQVKAISMLAARLQLCPQERLDRMKRVALNRTSLQMMNAIRSREN